MHKLLSDYSVCVEMPVAWGDMDAWQHVNNTRYIRYFEDARIAYFRKINLLEVQNETDVGAIVASVFCKFITPLYYPDTVYIGARADKIEDDRFTFNFS